MILRFVVSCLFLLLLAATAEPCAAQFSGAIGLGGQATNNVQSLDTTAPDQILLPAIDLSYDLLPSASSRITLSASYSPNFYAVNPALSYNATTFGATGLFYLSNVDAITKEAQTNGEQLLQMPSRLSRFSRLPEPDNFAQPVHTAEVDADSLVDVASSALYTLSGELDSTDIATTGLSKSRVKEFEELRDSISDALSTVADLLDSVGYSESTSEVLISELKHLRAPLAALMPHTKPFHTDAHLLDVAIEALRMAKPESDFLATAPSPTPTPTSPGTGSVSQSPPKSLAETLQKLSPSTGKPPEVYAPTMTLVSSESSLRDFGANDVSVMEDIDDSAATTLATRLSVPISWNTHSATQFDSAKEISLFGAGFSGNPNDYHSVAFGAALEGLPNSSFSLRGSFDYTRAVFPFDSVYSNTENRLRLFSRIGAGTTSIVTLELSLGLRDYLNPLKVSTVHFDTLRGPKGKIIKIDSSGTVTTAASKFSQYSYGLGFTQFIGERWVLGIVTSFNRNPQLRAYVTSAQVATGPRGRAVRAAVQIADDEYTYDLSRLALFSTSRMFWDLDLGIDLAFENRTYGSAVGPKGNPIPGGQGRTENVLLPAVALSKLIPFVDRLGGIFNSLSLEALLRIESVNSTGADAATNQLYTYNASNFTVTAALGF